ncbi:hypothetical protein SBADM41S_12038 [Streptomyces badius]
MPCISVLVLERLHPVRAAPGPSPPVRDEQVLGLGPRVRRIAWPLAPWTPVPRPRWCAASRGVRGRASSPEPDVSELQQVQGTSSGRPQVHHLARRRGQRLPRAPAESPPCRRAGVRGDGHERYLLRRGVRGRRRATSSPPRTARLAATPHRRRWRWAWVAVGEHAAHLVELAHDRLALESAAPGRVPGAEDLDRMLQGLDLLGADRCGLVPVETGGIGVQRVVGPWRVGRRSGVAVQPVVHGPAMVSRRRARRPHPPSRVG